MPDQTFKLFFICFDLILLGLTITLDLALYSMDYNKSKDKNREYYLDEDGNHSYYERSLIRKNRFIHSHPNVPKEKLRTFSRFIQEFFHPNPQ